MNNATIEIMLGWLLFGIRVSPNNQFCQRLISDAVFRARALERVSDAEVRACFEHLEDVLLRQRGQSLERRLRYSLAFPDIRLATGISPTALERPPKSLNSDRARANRPTAATPRGWAPCPTVRGVQRLHQPQRRKR